MGPRELASLFTYYDAVLASVHEGMVLLDGDGRIVSVNAEGRRLLGLTDEAIGRTAVQAGLPEQVAELIDDPDILTDELALSDNRVLLISRRPVLVKGNPAGAVVTLRDHTELESLTGELDRVQGFSDALSAQAHESANRLHTVISLIELGETDHALTFAVAELQTAQSLADRVLTGVGNPAVAALLLAKSAQAAERGIELTIRKGSYLPPDAAPDQELVTIVGNLVDNAFDVLSTMSAAEDGDRRVEVAGEVLGAEGGNDIPGVRITVTDTGPGVDRAAGGVGVRPGLVDQDGPRPGRRPRAGPGAGCAGSGAVRRNGDGRGRSGSTVPGLVAVPSGSGAEPIDRAADHRHTAAQQSADRAFQ